MKLRVTLLAGAAVLAGATSVPALAQSDQTIETVVVSGMRASLESAMSLKKNSASIVDSIVAEDIGKFPDLNVTDSLQHITGVQVTRDLGEGGGIAIRGLQQVQTTLNGQEIMTAGGSRILNLQDVPSELVAGIDVYKTPQASQLEGGLGGLVDIRTARPFDFNSMQLRADFRVAYADLAKSAKPQASALYADRWNTAIGEVGALVSVSFQERAFHQSFDSAGSPAWNTYAISGTSVATSTGFWNPTIDGHRDRMGINASLQWRPTSELDFYFDANFLKFSTYQNQYTYYAYPSFANSVAGTFTVFPGTTDLATGTYTGNMSFGTYGTARDNTDTTQNYVLGGNWNHGNLTVTSNVQYVRGRSNLYYTAVGATTPFTSLSEDMTTTVPSYSFSGGNFTSLSAYTVNSLAYNENQYYATQLAAKMDAQYQTSWGPIKEIDAGVRYAVHDNNFQPIRFVGTFTAKNGADVQNMMVQYHNTGFSGVLSGYSLPNDIWTADPNFLRANLSGIKSMLGNSNTPYVDPKSPYTQSERITSGYLQARVETELLVPITGVIGGRVMNTNTSILGYKSNIVNGVVSGYTAYNPHTTRTDFLPSVTMTAHLSDELKLRASFSKTLNLPSFSSLAPGLTLVPGNNSGNGGNPELKPMQATSYDVSLEYYFGKSDSVYLALFNKDVKNFWATRAVTMTIDGVDWNITTTGNAENGKAQGFEVGYTQFYDFLPGLLSGLGMQANYTYVDSSAPSQVVGLSTPLQYLSRHSANLIGMYEKGPISARIAYNWRSSYYNSLYAASGQFAGTAAIFNKAYGWLDASVSYDLDENLTLSLEGSNLLHTRIDQYFTTTTRPASTTINDRQFIVGVRYKM
jgi:iron complex outermembrane recepter protein